MLKRNSLNAQKKKKGQSTVEYILLVAVIMSFLIVFLKPKGVFYKAYNHALGNGTSGMEDMALRLKDSRGTYTPDTK